jgi:hypothetical protein
MAIILSAKKLRSILQNENESFLVFSHNKSGVIRVIGMQEYLQEERKRSRPEENEERQG